jgi:hypothetical protein
MAEFKPILLKVAVNEKEKLEIRSQALLALSDWSLLFSEILQPCQVADDTVSFLDIVKEMITIAHLYCSEQVFRQLAFS